MCYPKAISPVYIVKVPWLHRTMSEQEIAAELARLQGRLVSDLPTGLTSDAAEISGQVFQRQLTKVELFFDAGLNALRKQDLKTILSNLATNLSGRAEQVEAAGKSHSTIPPYNRRFVGRLEQLTNLRQLLLQGRTGVISGHKRAGAGVASVHGLGGIGKTELAFTYSHAFAGLYPGGRFLIPAEGRNDLRFALLHLDAIFQDQISDEQRKSLDLHFAAIREGLRKRLSRLGRILLVVDNVTDLTLIQPEQLDCIRTLGADMHVLATTRLGAPVQSWADTKTSIGSRWGS